ASRRKHAHTTAQPSRPLPAPDPRRVRALRQDTGPPRSPRRHGTKLPHAALALNRRWKSGTCLASNRRKSDDDHSLFPRPVPLCPVPRETSGPLEKGKETFMYKVRGGFLGVVVVGALLSVLPTSGFAGSQPTAEQRAACTGDYMRFCFSLNPNADG